MYFFSIYVLHAWHFTLHPTTKVLLFSFLLIACFFSSPLLVQPEEIDAHKKEIASITEKETRVIAELENLNFDLNDARQTIFLVRKDIVKIDQLIIENRDSSNALSKKIMNNEKYASQRIVALYKLNQIGKFNLLASTESLYDFFHRKIALEKILHQDEMVLEMLQKNQNALYLVRQNLDAQKKKKDSLGKRLSAQIQEMTQKRQKRARLLNKIRNKKALTMAAIESLKQSAEALDTTFSDFKKENPGKRPYSDSSPHAFTDLKGLLIMPVNGKIVEFFGPYTNTEFNLVNFRSGINIRAERGEPILAVYKGKTLYASWFKGYGNMIIIDHGDHYYTLYAHAEELFKKKGDPVEAGEVIATIGDTGSMAKPGLHFEVRYHGKPIDPAPWINKG
jgi:septal ring factor EnvC (AmiA/AmiB activator)